MIRLASLVLALLTFGTGMAGATTFEDARAGGFYRTPDGTIYYYNGYDAYCAYATWDQYVRAGGTAGAWTNVPHMPYRLRYDGICGSASPGPVLSAGWYRTPDGTIYYSNGYDAFCAYATWEHYVRAGGSAGAWSDVYDMPYTMRYDGYCR